MRTAFDQRPGALQYQRRHRDRQYRIDGHPARINDNDCSDYSRNGSQQVASDMQRRATDIQVLPVS